MTFFRPSRIIVICIALFSMLFMQLAVASYACPGMTAGSTNSVASMSADVSAMVDCVGMDAVLPSLCHALAHADTAKQSLDNPHSLDVQPFVPAMLFYTLAFAEPKISFNSLPSGPSWLEHTSSPPVSILNCCFRI
jgi:hypothetical protein